MKLVVKHTKRLNDIKITFAMQTESFKTGMRITYLIALKYDLCGIISFR